MGMGTIIYDLIILLVHIELERDIGRTSQLFLFQYLRFWNRRAF